MRKIAFALICVALSGQMALGAPSRPPKFVENRFETASREVLKLIEEGNTARRRRSAPHLRDIRAARHDGSGILY